MTDDAKKRFREMLLHDIKNGIMEWYYIGMDDGGCFLRARGPTEAWSLMHALGYYGNNTTGTTTSGPIDNKTMDDKIPLDMRWRKLTHVEIANIT